MISRRSKTSQSITTEPSATRLLYDSGDMQVATETEALEFKLKMKAIKSIWKRKTEVLSSGNVENLRSSEVLNVIKTKNTVFTGGDKR